MREFGGAGTVYWQAIEADAEGKVTEESLGNGLTTLREFDPASGLVQNIRVYDGLTAIQDKGYAFDFLGNLESRIDRLGNREETFAYDVDGLNRLTDATVIDTVTLAQVAQTTTTYDAFGNLTFKSGVGGYVYNGVDGGPHAVTRAGGVDYVYDANGAMVSATFTGGGASLRSFTWSSFNKPVRIEGAGGILASEFVYGPSRARIRQTVFSGAVETGAITYIGGAFERHTATGAPDELVHYIAAGGVVAIFTKVDDGAPATDRLRYPHKDHLGSVDMVTDETGAVAESRSFGPWGRARNTDWSAAGTDIPLTETKRGFTGHEHLDNVGLIHMNGRIYDPVIGRMVSADPIVQAPSNSQSHNRYSYVMNNPLSFTDPSGFWSLNNVFRDINRAVVGISRFLLTYAPTIINIGFAFAGMPYLGAILSNAWSVANGASLTDVMMGVTVGMAGGWITGPISGAISRGMGLAARHLSTALIRGGLGGAFTGGMMAAIKGQNIWKGIRGGALAGMATATAFWGYRAYRTGQFIENNLDCGTGNSSSCTDAQLNAIKDAGQSPSTQGNMGKFRGSNTKLKLLIDPNGLIGVKLGPNMQPTNEMYFDGVASNAKQYFAREPWGPTMDSATIFAHELGHTLTVGNGLDFVGQGQRVYTLNSLRTQNPNANNVAYSENPYRLWMGAPPRLDYGVISQGEPSIPVIPRQGRFNCSWC